MSDLPEARKETAKEEQAVSLDKRRQEGEEAVGGHATEEALSSSYCVGHPAPEKRSHHHSQVNDTAWKRGEWGVNIILISMSKSLHEVARFCNSKTEPSFGELVQIENDSVLSSAANESPPTVFFFTYDLQDYPDKISLIKHTAVYLHIQQLLATQHNSVKYSLSD